MVRKPSAKLVREALLAGGVFVLLVLAAGGADLLEAAAPVAAALPFAAAALATAMLTRMQGPVDTVVQWITRRREVTPYSALADAAQRLRSPSLREALPGLARALAEGTGARRAVVWLAAEERLVATTWWPALEDDGTPESAENLAVLLARSGTGHVVPVLDGSDLRAALSIEKPGLAITPADRVLLRDVAHGAAMLLRTVALNAELADRVRRADHLAQELRASRQRLAQAREVERRRLLTELSRATSGRLIALRVHVAAARAELGEQGTGRRSAGAALVRARAEVDELIDRFRVIARGVYPAVLRSQGPGAALEELVADLRRPVRLTGDLGVRVAWEIESAVYQVTAAALTVLAERPAGVIGLAEGPAGVVVRAERPAGAEIHVRLTRGGSRMRVLVEDPSPPVSAERVRAVLVDDIERLAALGGDLVCTDGRPALRLNAWLPDRLDALLDSSAAA